ncbi:MAG: hypothetical protein PWQ87_745 [Candidatus Woesearchaeota archaeon]|nr:hypothetical protein [Candidatus Woesearchaeota archaeon]
MADSYYNKIAKFYNSFRKEEQLEKALFVKSLIEPKNDETMLDVGCGTGISMSVFDCHIIGIDPSEEMLKNNPFEAIKGYAESIPFADNSFDYVISITAAQNFKNIEKAIAEIYRVCKKKSVITIMSNSKKLPYLRKQLKKHFPEVKEYILKIDTAFLCIK